MARRLVGHGGPAATNGGRGDSSGVACGCTHTSGHGSTDRPPSVVMRHKIGEKTKGEECLLARRRPRERCRTRSHGCARGMRGLVAGVGCTKPASHRLDRSPDGGPSVFAPVSLGRVKAGSALTLLPLLQRGEASLLFPGSVEALGSTACGRESDESQRADPCATSTTTRESNLNGSDSPTAIQAK